MVQCLITTPDGRDQYWAIADHRQEARKMLHPDTLHQLAHGHISEMRHEADMARLASENRPTAESRRAQYIRTVTLSLAMLTALLVWLS